MIPRGEVGFMFASIGKALKGIDDALLFRRDHHGDHNDPDNTPLS